jgi:hypothetical protein
MWATIVPDDRDPCEDRSSTETIRRSTRYDRVFETVDGEFVAGL